MTNPGSGLIHHNFSYYLSQQDFYAFNRTITVDCTRKVRCIMRELPSDIDTVIIGAGPSGLPVQFSAKK